MKKFMIGPSSWYDRNLCLEPSPGHVIRFLPHWASHCGIASGVVWFRVNINMEVDQRMTETQRYLVVRSCLVLYLVHSVDAGMHVKLSAQRYLYSPFQFSQLADDRVHTQGQGRKPESRCFPGDPSVCCDNRIFHRVLSCYRWHCFRLKTIDVRVAIRWLRKTEEGERVPMQVVFRFLFFPVPFWVE